MSAFDTSTPAVVLKFDQNVLHHGGLGVIRGLGRFGVPVHCLHEERFAPAAHSRHLRGRWLWRVSAEDVGNVLAGLRGLAERLGRPAVLFPTDDAAAIFLAEHGHCLRDWFRFPQPPPELPRRVAGKYTLHRLCRESGVPSAEAELGTDWQRVRDFADRVGFPLVAKLAEPWSRHARSVPSTSIVHGRQQLADLHRASRGGLMLQEFLPGAPEGDWFFHGYCGVDARCVAFTGVKDRSYPAHSGLTSLGRAVPNPKLRALATDLLARTGFRGIVDLDFRQDARDGRYKLLDFNPRLGAQFRLFQDPQGLDLAMMAYLDLTGQESAFGEPPAENSAAGGSLPVESLPEKSPVGEPLPGQSSLGKSLPEKSLFGSSRPVRSLPGSSEGGKSFARDSPAEKSTPEVSPAEILRSGTSPAEMSPAETSQSGRRFVVENYDPIAAFGYWRRGELGLLTWCRSLRHVDERAWFARDDVVPFLLMCLWMGWRATNRPFRRSARPPTPWPRYRSGRAADPGAVRRPRQPQEDQRDQEDPV